MLGLVQEYEGEAFHASDQTTSGAGAGEHGQAHDVGASESDKNSNDA